MFLATGVLSAQIFQRELAVQADSAKPNAVKGEGDPNLVKEEGTRVEEVG